MTRAELLAQLFNAAPLAHRRRRHQRQIDDDRHDRLDPARAGREPHDHERRGDEELHHRARRRSPARWSARGDAFVSEVDESDGSIALFSPRIAVVEQHLARPQDRWTSCARCSATSSPRRRRRCSISTTKRRRRSRMLSPKVGIDLQLERSAGAICLRVRLRARAGGHRVRGAANAARRAGVPRSCRCRACTMSRMRWRRLRAARACGVSLQDAAHALEQLQRHQATARDAWAPPNGVTVIDDFAHNPDKIAATLGDAARLSRTAARHVPAARLRTAEADEGRLHRLLRGESARRTTC